MDGRRGWIIKTFMDRGGIRKDWDSGMWKKERNLKCIRFRDWGIRWVVILRQEHWRKKPGL